MRCDVALSRLCLFKTRSQAGKACAEGRVRINGAAARPASEVRTGDRISWLDQFGRTEQEVEVLALPEGSVSRVAAREMVRPVGRRELDGTGWGPAGSGGTEPPGGPGPESR